MSGQKRRYTTFQPTTQELCGTALLNRPFQTDQVTPFAVNLPPPPLQVPLMAPQHNNCANSLEADACARHRRGLRRSSFHSQSDLRRLVTSAANHTDDRVGASLVGTSLVVRAEADVGVSLRDDEVGAGASVRVRRSPEAEEIAPAGAGSGEGHCQRTCVGRRKLFERTECVCFSPV